MTKKLDWLTIDELSRAANVKVSTIRMYQHRGLLSGPQIDGRVGYYGHHHLHRLQLIARLQEEGYSLAAIGRLVRAWESGRGLADLLGEEEPVTVSREEFETLFPRLAESDELLARLEALGALRQSGSNLILSDDRLLRVGVALADTGISLDSVIAEAEHTLEVTEGLADRFVRLFERHVWRPYVRAGMPSDELPHILDRLNQLQPLAVEAVAAAMRNALRRAGDQAFQRAMQELSAPQSKTGSKESST